MKRLGITQNKKQKKKRDEIKVKQLLGEFFKNDKHARKFTDREKEEFIKNFSESFVNGGHLQPVQADTPPKRQLALPPAPKPRVGSRKQRIDSANLSNSNGRSRMDNSMHS